MIVRSASHTIIGQEDVMKTIQRRNELPLIKGNLFDYVENYIHDSTRGCNVIVPHVCNNIGLFGAGFAAGVSNRYPVVRDNYQLLGSKFLKSNMGYSQLVDVTKSKVSGYKLVFANMIAQNGTIALNNPRPLNYYALSKSMANVAQYIQNNFDKDNPVQIHCPKFGCGLAGGDWNFIEELIKDIWGHLPVFVYVLK